MRRLDTEISRLSDGRVTFDARRRRLEVRGEGGRGDVVMEISETGLRNWLQRLLLAGPPRAGHEPHESAILLLVDRLGAADAVSSRRAS